MPTNDKNDKNHNFVFAIVWSFFLCPLLAGSKSALVRVPTGLKPVGTLTRAQKVPAGADVLEIDGCRWCPFGIPNKRTIKLATD